MNQNLQTILNLIQQSEHLSDEEKIALSNAAKSADKELEIAAFKLDRTEKVKHTTAILLEETIAELEQKRKAVEAQNRELEIEASLERVRAVAMSMNKPDDMLDVCSTISNQLESLKVKEIRNIQTAIFYEAKGTYMNYEYYAKHNKTFITETSYTNHEIHQAFANQMLKGKDEFFERHINCAELPGWIAYQKTTNVFIDAFLETATSLNYYWYSLGPVALGISTYSPLNEEAMNLFKRFLKVFELSYRRYLDIETAEEQAREARIETALEKIRSRSLAMHKSDELWEVVAVVFEKLQELKFAIDGAAFISTFIEGSKDINGWVAGNDSQPYPTNLRLPYLDSPSVNDIWQAKESGLDFFSKTYSFEEKNHWLRYAFENSGLRSMTDEFKNWILEQPCMTQSIALGKNSILGIHFHHQKTLSETEVDILKRFSKVFDQAYIRFLDLKKAEAQARESQIQLAMERVRARTMAMQHSNELSETSALLFQQIKALGVPPWSCGFNIWEKGDTVFTSYMGSPDGAILEGYKIPLTEEAAFIHFQESRDRGDKLFIDMLEGERLEAHYRYFLSLPEIKKAFEKRAQAGEHHPTFQINHLANFSHGNLLFITYEPCPEAHDIFIRFAAVFEQTYTRFLDLQKAEEQARESQIQLALERVRARTMAMQRSDELQDAASVMVQQIQTLGVPQFGSGFNIWDDDRKAATAWMCNVITENLPPPFKTSSAEDIFLDIHDAAQRGETLFVREQAGKELETHYKYMNSIPVFKEYAERVFVEGFFIPDFQIMHCAFFSQGYLMFITYEHVPEAHDIFKRFAKVFEQTYTRFLDLQKAEAQARESQIEAALEKVRSRTMAMQKSDELAEVASVLFQQVKGLGVPQWTCGVCIFEIDDKEFTWYPGSADDIFPPGKIPLNEHPVFIQFNESRKRGDELYVYEKGGEVQAEHYRYMLSLPGVREYMQSRVDAGFQFPSFQIDHLANFSHGNIVFITYEHFPEMHDVFKRFAKVFDQTYTRFLDLQKSEAQAREAKIEAALERVRSRTMAMQRSDELADVAEILFKQVKELGIHAWTTGFNIWQEGNDAYIDWITSPSGGFVEPYTVDLTAHPFFREISDAKKRGDDFQVFEISGEPLAETYALLMSFAPKQFEGFLASGFSFPTRQVNHYVFGAQVGLMFITPEPYPEAHDIFKRFGKVFEQTYTRFLDLQKAEAQTRESQIEAALERVRSRTMGMQKSEELREVIQVIYEQFVQLNIRIDGAGFAMDYMESDDFNFWLADPTSAFPYQVHIPYFDHPQFNRYKEAKEKGLDFYTSGLAPEERNRFFDHISKYIPISQELKEVVYNAPGYETSHVVLKNVILYILNFSGLPFSGADNDTLMRFGRVFEQTYTRFNDLKKAEAQAREAIKQASVDRVRAEIASMRTTNDLERITPLIWNELTTLGVPFIRCGVFIMDEEKQELQTHLSTPDGKAIAAFRLPYNAPGETARIIASWHKKEMYKQHWNEAQFIEFTTNLVQQGAVTSGEKYLTENRPTNLYLHFLPFLQGMLYAGNTAPLSDDELHLMQDLADAFSTAYARYEDFNKLEAAKKQVDSTLNELQATQKQLIQSEKMASLGELTAGIAHEIQNPLNFVNNFSEVSNELIGEMVEEVDKGNTAEVKAIALDVQQNLEKILHHGKRADSIVKGMLQHSRKSTGQKEPTDINVLADECLRLSYHGLRAKEKSFNATINTNFDESIGKINIVPQDIGRVLLNTINNAFYAVSERRKAAGETLPAGQAGFKPTVSVSTKKENDKVTISVRDNGNGIPKKIVDKIFQPFFTTKPTGSGTGLGLSLSYDIVKAHGGEIKVETKEGEGSEFIIQLPI